MFKLPRRARVGEPANARPAGGAAGVPGMSRESTHGENDWHDRRRPARVSRLTIAALSELHRVPSEDSRKLHRQEFTQMRILPLVVLFLPLAAQTPADPQKSP